MARAEHARDREAFEAARQYRCICVSGGRCDSPESGHPEYSYSFQLARAGERCCTSRNCGDGLACDPLQSPSVCAPVEAVAEKEVVASCAATGPKIWELASPTACGAGGRDSRGYESLRWAVGPNIDRVRYVAAADRATLESIESGIFLVLSGAGSRASRSSRLPPAVEMLREVLGQVGSEVEVVVAEKRCLAQDLVALLKLRCDERGDGEVAWIRHGKIVATTGYGFHLEKIGPNTELLLSPP